ncbi:MAG: hypothetical protein RL417_1045, partial [Pseudomonadota bacterium]
MSIDFRIVVLISGRGSNLHSLLAAAQRYRITRVISNKEEAPGLAIAARANIPTASITRARYPTLDAQKSAILEAVARESPDLVVLAGFMQILAPDFVSTFRRRILNIHPSLLPKFVGLDTHSRAIAAREHEHGCSVHLVDLGLDSGEVIAQATVPILPHDTPESLGARVLEREHKLYPWVVNSVAI